MILDGLKIEDKINPRDLPKKPVQAFDVRISSFEMRGRQHVFLGDNNKFYFTNMYSKFLGMDKYSLRRRFREEWPERTDILVKDRARPYTYCAPKKMPEVAKWDRNKCKRNSVLCKSYH